MTNAQNDAHREASTAEDLLAALADPAVQRITVTANLSELPTLALQSGQALLGGVARPILRFAAGQDGVRLSADNALEELDLVTDPDCCAVCNDTTVDGLGRILLREVRTVGAVRILARDRVRGGHVEAHGVDVEAADARGYGVRPKGYGVEVIPGAFTLWNQQDDPAVTVTAELTGLSAGRAGAPVHGSGIFVAGAGKAGGRLVVRLLETGQVHSQGGIAPGTADRISGGVFTVSGAVVGTVRNRGPVTTYGPNDMVLDNWGTVDRWTAEEKVTSHGPSGIGFVNFGTINRLEVNAAIETFGGGARGFNVYAGTVQTAVFERVVTHADGAVGIQLSQPVGDITVRRGLETFGGVGPSLVKGVVVKLPATALSIKPGGSARRIRIRGGLAAHGRGIEPLQFHGSVGSLEVSGGFDAPRDGFEGI